MVMADKALSPAPDESGVDEAAIEAMFRGADDAVPETDAETQPDGDAQGEDGEGTPEDDGDAVADATAVQRAAYEAWLQTEDGKAYERDKKRQLKRAIKEAVLKTLDDPGYRKELDATERGMVDEILTRLQPAQAQQSDAQWEPWYARAEQLTELWSQDKDAWGEAVEENAQDTAIWNWAQGWRNHFGLSSRTPVATLRARIAEFNRQQAVETVKKTSAQLDPIAIYEEFEDRPEWDLFTMADQDALHPNSPQFKDLEGAQKIRAMERKYGEVAARVGARKGKQAAVREAAALNGQAQAAQAAATPAVLGGAALRARDPLTAITAYNRALEASRDGTVPAEISKARDAALARLRVS